LTPFFNVYPEFIEKNNVVTINYNSAKGSVVVLMNGSTTDQLGLDSVESNQFRAYAFSTYTIYVTPKDSDGYTLNAGWFTMDFAQYDYMVMFDSIANEAQIVLNGINLDWTNLVISITFSLR
jgi:hypothetical protein